MKIMPVDTKFAYLGKPGTVFSKGFERRLKMVSTNLDLNKKKILDLGCGEGVWLSQFARFSNSENVFGSEIDAVSVEDLKNKIDKNKLNLKKENIINCSGENLKFPDKFFDVVFQNEVLEHVEDDQKTINECLRVLRENGFLVLFTPNKMWPFEQHGIFLFGKYFWGNIPLVPYLPKFVQKKLTPHVKNYSDRDLKLLINKAKVKGYYFDIVLHRHVFPGFDGLVKKLGVLGVLVQKFFFLLEKTPFHYFGISHFLIAKKIKISPK